MKQFIAIAIIFGSCALGVVGCQHPKTTQIQTPTLPPAVGDTLPPGVPPVSGETKIAFALRYQDITLGTGAEAEPNKIYKVNYTGWLASDGHKFDSSYDHKSPVMDKDGKPELEADGKPKMNDGEPISFPQGFGRVIPGFDQGFTGMRVGGKRRLFIPWQLAYGARGRPGPNPENPGIPPKADLIFDIELVDVSEMPAPQARPGMMNGPNGQPMRMMPHPPAPGTMGTPATPPPTAKPAEPGTTPPAGTSPPSSTTTTPPAEKPQSN
jgi:peptidylprolyl isomerase